jgi:transposase InsO family protein
LNFLISARLDRLPDWEQNQLAVLSTLGFHIRTGLTHLVVKTKRLLHEAIRPLPAVVGLLRDLTRTREPLIAENALLRQRLIVASRKVKRPVFKPHERGLMALLAGIVRCWRDAVLLVKPETILRWHREGFRLFWKWKSQQRKPAAREVIHVGVTRAPTEQWTAQQLRNITPFGEAPDVIIRDNDSKFGSEFDRVAKGAGMKVVRTAVKSPLMNARCERFLGSVRRERLDHIIILGQRHLANALNEYCFRYFNKSRPHQGIRQRIPSPLASKKFTSGASGGCARWGSSSNLHKSTWTLGSPRSAKCPLTHLGWQALRS